MNKNISIHFDSNLELVKIYLEREKMYCKLMYQDGKTWEEANQIIEQMDFQDRIDAIVYPKGKKKEYEYEVGKKYYFYTILDFIGASNPVATINGVRKYARFLIKRVGYMIYLGNDQFLQVFDNVESEDELNTITNLGFICKTKK